MHTVLIMYLSFSVGQRILHYQSDVLETVVLVNPSEETTVSEVSQTHDNQTTPRSVIT